MPEESIEAWRSVAAGWERQRDFIRASTRPVSERLVELLAPKPGDEILELAAGPGDTGFLALESMQPDGRLVSTDVAPEMVDAGRRRAAELELDGVDFAVEDAAALTFGDQSFDGVLCRWGLMLVPDPDVASREITRVLRPGGRAAVAVWASPDANDWMTAGGRAAVALGLMERPDAGAPGPFRLSGDGLVEEVLGGAGLAVETVEDVPMTWHAPSLDAWWAISNDISRMLSLLVQRLSSEERAAVRREAERRLEPYVQADGSLLVPSLARLALATRPA